MEYRVNFPSLGNAEVVGSLGNDLLNFERAGPFHLEFLWSIHSEIGGLKPDLVSFFPWGELGGDLFLHFLLCDMMRGLGIILGQG